MNTENTVAEVDTTTHSGATETNTVVQVPESKGSATGSIIVFGVLLVLGLIGLLSYNAANISKDIATVEYKAPVTVTETAPVKEDVPSTTAPTTQEAPSPTTTTQN